MNKNLHAYFVAALLLTGLANVHHVAHAAAASVTSAAYGYSSTSSSKNVSVTANEGDLVIIGYVNENGSTEVTTPSDWTLLATGTGGTSTGGRLTVVARIAPSGWEEGTTVNFSMAHGRRAAATVHVIPAAEWYGSIADGVSIQTTFGSSDVPSVTASWGSADNLFIALGGTFDDDAVATAAPENYTDLQTAASGGGEEGLGAGAFSASRQLTADSDDPGAFTISNTDNINRTTLIVIRPSDTDVVATKLIFGVQPGNVVVGQTFGAFTVRAVDDDNALDEDFDGSVTITLQTGSGTLSGTTTRAAVGGIATFDDISINTLNTGAVIRASTSDLAYADSDPFDVTAGGSGAAGFPSSSRLGGLLQ